MKMLNKSKLLAQLSCINRIQIRFFTPQRVFDYFKEIFDEKILGKRPKHFKPKIDFDYFMDIYEEKILGKRPKTLEEKRIRYGKRKKKGELIEENYPFWEENEGFTEEEYIFFYYDWYWIYWHMLRDEGMGDFFINFAERHVTHDPVKAEGFEYHYPLEMYALFNNKNDPLVREYNPDTDLVEDFDGEMFDPFTNELLSRPLNSIRWDYFLSNWEENDRNSNYSPYNSNWRLLDALEEEFDVIDSIVDILHTPEYRNSPLYDQYMKFANRRLFLLATMYDVRYPLGGIPLVVGPIIVVWLVVDVLYTYSEHATIMLLDIKAVTLYLFFGHKLIWEYEETFEEKRFYYYRLFPTVFSTLKNDLHKVWRFINLEKNEPKIYRKMKEYHYWTLMRQLELARKYIRMEAILAKQESKIFIFNCIQFLRFLLFVLKQLIILYNYIKSITTAFFKGCYYSIKNFSLYKYIINSIDSFKRMIKRVIYKLNYFWELYNKKK